MPLIPTVAPFCPLNSKMPFGQVWHLSVESIGKDALLKGGKRVEGGDAQRTLNFPPVDRKSFLTLPYIKLFPLNRVFAIRVQIIQFMYGYLFVWITCIAHKSQLLCYLP